jgi:hypothetical protein
MSAKIEFHHGSPTLFLDGKPVFYSLMWGSPPEPESYPFRECARHYADAGVHFYAFDIGTVGSPPEWRDPQTGQIEPYDFSSLAQRFQHVIDVDPQARFHLRVHLEMPEWWQHLHPLECEILSDGRRAGQSFASVLWRQQANNFLTALIRHIESVGLIDRIVAFQCGAGHTGEWVKGAGAMGLVCGDASAPMREHFGGWLRKHYQDNVAALRESWADPEVSFENALVPGADAQFSTAQFTFRDPRKEQAVIDYYRCLAELCGDLVVDFCTTVKQVGGGKILAGAFYGYLMELSWNAGFFAEGVDSEYATIQRSGHLGLWKVLQSAEVDFLVSPYSYGFRGIGGEGAAMPPTESMRLHKKLYVLEDDTRTHLSLHDRLNYGRGETLEESVAILQRNFANVIAHGQSIWWLAGWNPGAPHVDLSREPAFRPLIQRFHDMGTWALNLDRTPSAQVAIVIDDESFLYEGVKNNLDLPLIFQQRLRGLAHMGAPFDVYLLNDLLGEDVKPYVLYIFLNAFRLDVKRREALQRVVCKDGQTALWIYAPGYEAEDDSLESMAALTGITFGAGTHPWGPFVHLTNLNHPITRGLSQDISWGTNSLIGPVFHAADEKAQVLGDVVYSLGRCLPGFVLKEFPQWNSVYSAAPNLPASVLRGLARYAGVHLYNENGDTLYATPDLLAVHTAAGGERDFHLRGKVEIVYDLFGQKVVARNVDRFQVVLAPASTVLFYTGEISKLRALEGDQV